MVDKKIKMKEENIWERGNRETHITGSKGIGNIWFYKPSLYS
jgi:hypothetical protein